MKGAVSDIYTGEVGQKDARPVHQRTGQRITYVYKPCQGDELVNGNRRVIWIWHKECKR